MIPIDSSVYPTFEIYPGNVVPPQVPFKKASPVKLDTNYPHLEICMFYAYSRWDNLLNSLL